MLTLRRERSERVLPFLPMCHHHSGRKADYQKTPRNLHATWEDNEDSCSKTPSGVTKRGRPCAVPLTTPADIIREMSSIKCS